jgi:hypothetical protein
VVLGGVASATKTVTPLDADGRQYEVAVSDIGGLGPLSVSIPAGAVHDIADNGNLDSTSADSRVAFDFGPVLADADLEQAVRESLGLPARTPVGRSWLSQLTTLSADANLIGSLEGLQYATNLRSLKLWPSDWSIAPAGLAGADPLAPLAGLTHLSDVSLARLGLSNSEIDVLAGLPGPRALDLRYNEITDLAALAPAAGIESLLVYGNPIVDFSAMRGKLVDLDVRPGDPEKAETIGQLAAALGYSPVRMYEYVYNNFEYEAYAGLLKGTQATLETRAGMEHAIWERMYNVESMSTVRSLGLAHERGIPVFEIDNANASTYIPQLTLAANTVSAIQSFIAQGATVTVPRDPTPLNNWNGVGYVAALAGFDGVHDFRRTQRAGDCHAARRLRDRQSHRPHDSPRQREYQSDDRRRPGQRGQWQRDPR